MPNDYRYIGHQRQRRDATGIVTGTVPFMDDLKFPNLLYGKVLRSPHAHANIKKIDKSRALALPGVKAVVTWEDIPDWRGGTPRLVRVLDNKVRYVGDAVALVAAASEQIAEEALRRLYVEYELLPAVVDMARDRLKEEGLLDRATLAAGNYHLQELPAGHDLALLSAIIHSNSPEENLELYRKIFRSLNPGGRILIRDHVMNPDRTQPRDGALFAVNMLVGTPGGGTYTYEEIQAGLRQAGFDRIRFLARGDHMDAVVEAFKP